MSLNTTTLGAGHETIRFRGPAKEKKLDGLGNEMKPKRWIDRHTGLLVDLVRRAANPPWVPSMSLAFRIIIFARFTAAMYTGITDCDEVFNFWEPLHYLSKNAGFQTWELSPSYAVRSWAYISAYLPAAEIIPYLMNLGKRQAFFCVRIANAFICSFAEARFYGAVVENVNDRVGRYLLFSMLLSAGMWNASTAFLASTTSMHTTLLAYSFYLKPTSSAPGSTARIVFTVFFFAVGAVFAWPFSLLLAVPFVYEELFIGGRDLVGKDGRWEMFSERFGRLYKAAVIIAGVVITPVLLVDSAAYGRLTLSSVNIVLYNLFARNGGGPDLYGTSPASFYFINLFLNFNFLFPLALLSAPALLVTYFYDYRRLGSLQRKPTIEETSNYTLVALRLSGFYLWLGVLSLQAHKEERFMYPAYPLLALNACVTIFLVRGWIEKAHTTWTGSQYQTSETKIMGYLTMCGILGTMALSVLRIFAIQTYYVAPLRTAYHFEYIELPSLLSTLGHGPIQHNGTNDWDEWDLSPIEDLNNGQGVRLCYGKEWHRYTSSWLVPDGVDVQWLKSEFDGALPARFIPSEKRTSAVWRREGTAFRTEGLNDLNFENVDVYVEPETCDYLVDSHFPLRPSPSPSSYEPTYVLDTDTWERLHCHQFLDAENSSPLQRAFWLPGSWWGGNGRLSWGDFCLLGRRDRRQGRIEGGDEVLYMKDRRGESRVEL